jgi:alkylation response protein AidB-like acyl-CoA dehydrogenase
MERLVIEFGESEAAATLRAQMREFLAENLTPELIEQCHSVGVYHSQEFNKKIAQRGWLALDWAVEDGGAGMSPIDVLSHREELFGSGAPIHTIGTTMMTAFVITKVGTEFQKEKILPRAFAGELVISLGITEPENGSDAAAAATRATRNEDGSWTINGSKMFTTNASVADYVYLLTRTNPDAPKHRGLTVFLVPFDTPGVEVQAVHTMSGERTNITYYSDVVVDDAWRVGEIDGGWDVMQVAFTREHSTAFYSEQIRLLADMRAWAQDTGAIERPEVRERIGRTQTELELSLLLQRRAVWLVSTGQPSHGLGSMAKLFSTERLERQAAESLELAGPDGIRAEGDPTALQGGVFEYSVRRAKGTTIYAGSSEIQRNIIAQAVLGLPRS